MHFRPPLSQSIRASARLQPAGRLAVSLHGYVNAGPQAAEGGGMPQRAVSNATLHWAECTRMKLVKGFVNREFSSSIVLILNAVFPHPPYRRWCLRMFSPSCAASTD
jgi:hypothetical protein